MNKKAVLIIVLIILASYFVATFLGLFGLGDISVYTDKDEYKLGEKITLDSINEGITVLCGTPYWYIYKINGSNETLVFSTPLKCSHCSWPKESVFGVNNDWDPSKPGFIYGGPYVDIYSGPYVEPPREGRYRIVAMVQGNFNPSASKIITVIK